MAVEVASIRIISTPPGQAPEHIRRAWVGLELPLAAGAGDLRTVHASGVLSGPRGMLGRVLGLFTGSVNETDGWVVPVRPAMEILARAAPEAEAWWRANAPRLFMGERHFVFAAACAQLVGAAAASAHASPRPPAQPSADRLGPATPTARLLLAIATLLAVDLGIPLGWRSGWLPITSARLWATLISSACMTVILAALLAARLRANQQREVDRQR